MLPAKGGLSLTASIARPPRSAKVGSVGFVNENVLIEASYDKFPSGDNSVGLPLIILIAPNLPSISALVAILV